MTSVVCTIAVVVSFMGQPKDIALPFYGVVKKAGSAFYLVDFSMNKDKYVLTDLSKPMLVKVNQCEKL